MNVGVVGATGQVGQVMRSVLVERDFPVEKVRFFASSRSAGMRLEWGGRQVEVEDAAAADYEGLDLVLMAAGKYASREIAPRIAGAGAIVVDNSSAWRMDPDVPSGRARGEPAGSRPDPEGDRREPELHAMVAMPVLWPIHLEAGLKRVVVATYQAVSGGGLPGVRELEEQIAKTADRASALTLSGQAVEFPPRSVYAEPIAHNVLPLAGSLVDDGSGETDEEQKYRDESRKILGIPDLPLVCTCVRVPVFCGHGAAITVELERELSRRKGHGDSRRGSRCGARRCADPAQGRRRRRLARRPDPPRSHRRAWPQLLRRRRQPEEGRGAQCRADSGRP